MLTVERWREALEARGCHPRPRGGGLRALCPVCQRDGGRHERALSIIPGDAGAAVYCHAAHCDYGELLAGAGLDHESGNGDRRSQSTPTKRPASVKTREVPKAARPEDGSSWTYHSADGRPLFVECRVDLSDGDKTFRVARHDQGSPTGWWWGMGDVEPVPYNLPSVVDVSRSGGTIHIAEGPKCADAIIEHGPETTDYTATTNPFGAGKWRDAFSDYLKGAARVIVHQDRDTPGEEHARKVAASVARVVPDVRIVLAQEPHHDIADHLEAGLPLDATVEVAIDSANACDVLPRFDFTAEPIPTEWVVEGWLTGGATLTILGGAGGDGKSLALQHLAVEFSRLGGVAFGEPVRGGPYRCLYLDGENPAAVIAERIPSLIKAASDPGERLYYVKLHGSNLEDPELYRQVKATIETFEPDWIFFDSLIGFHNRNENDPAAMRQFMRDYIRPLTRDLRGGGVMAHHLGKRGEYRTKLRDRLRGASGIYDEADFVWLMELKDDVRNLHYDKERVPGFEGALVLAYDDDEDSGGLKVKATTEKRSVRRLILDTLDRNGARALRKATLEAVTAEGYTRRSHDKAIKALSTGPTPLIEVEKRGMESLYMRTNQGTSREPLGNQ